MTITLSLPDEIQQTLATRLRTQRLMQALSQEDLAGMAGISVSALRKLERNGQCALITLIRVVQALGLLAEMENLFVSHTLSIAQMEQVAAVQQRQRAPRRKTLEK